MRENIIKATVVACIVAILSFIFTTLTNLAFSSNPMIFTVSGMLIILSILAFFGIIYLIYLEKKMIKKYKEEIKKK